MFVKNAVDAIGKTGYDDIRKIVLYANVREPNWSRKGELYHVYTGDHC